MAEPSVLTESVCKPESINGRTVRIAYFVSHPIQYQVPLLRRIAQEPDIEMTTFFSSDLSVRGYKDEGFGVEVKWDIPLLGGYRYEFLPRFRKDDSLGFAKPINRGIVKRLYHGRFDLAWVFGYHRLVCLQAIGAANLLRIPVLLQSDSNLFSPERPKWKLAVKASLAEFLKPMIDGVLAVGEANADYWHHYFGGDVPLFRYPYAVDNQFFRDNVLRAATRRDELRRELDLEAGRPVVLFAAKFLEWKRPADLIEAFIRLSFAPEAGKNAYLLMVGDGADRPNMERRVRESGLSNIRFLGFKNQTELPRYFDLCDIFVLPSHGEPWGLVVNEVMNAGRPVIVSDRVGCLADLVRDGFNGFVYPSKDVAALANCLRCLIDNPRLRTSMGENSLRIIHQHSFEQDVAGLRQALAHVLPGFRA